MPLGSFGHCGVEDRGPAHARSQRAIELLGPATVDAGFDPAVTGVRIAPTGVMNGASGASTPSFTVRFRTRIR